jgi:hypothetical protein
MHTLASHGYLLGHLGNTVAVLKAVPVHDQFVNIFNGKIGTAGKRLQCTVQSELFCTLWQCIQLDHPELAEYLLRAVQYLKSQPRCLEQEMHTDFDCDGGLSVLIALMNNTKLIIRPVDSTELQEIVLNKGDYIAFDGKLPHAGASYTTENLRVHFYCTKIGIAAPNNKVYIL